MGSIIDEAVKFIDIDQQKSYYLARDVELPERGRVLISWQDSFLEQLMLTKYPHIKIYNFNMHERYKKRELVMLTPQEIFNFANIFINNTPQEFMFYSDLYKKLSIIDECDYCYFFLATKNYHSVTRIAYDYAESKNKAIIKLP